MSVLILASLGGLISFLSTSFGAVLGHFSSRVSKTARWNLSIDFALGVMVSASAFTLIGPAAMSASSRGASALSVVPAAFLGMIVVFFLSNLVKSLEISSKFKSSHLILASVLMLHNLPEGVASGAVLGGLDWKAAVPLLTGISLQNVPEGALMVVSLRAMGISTGWAFFGGIASGLVEMAGGVSAGLLLNAVTGILPVLLTFAGGAMIASVLIELKEGEQGMLKRLVSREFVTGLVCLPLIQLIRF